MKCELKKYKGPGHTLTKVQHAWDSKMQNSVSHSPYWSRQKGTSSPDNVESMWKLAPFQWTYKQTNTPFWGQMQHIWKALKFAWRSIPIVCPTERAEIHKAHFLRAAQSETIPCSVSSLHERLHRTWGHVRIDIVNKWARSTLREIYKNTHWIQPQGVTGGLLHSFHWVSGD